MVCCMYSTLHYTLGMRETKDWGKIQWRVMLIKHQKPQRFQIKWSPLYRTLDYVVFTLAVIKHKNFGKMKNQHSCMLHFYEFYTAMFVAPHWLENAHIVTWIVMRNITHTSLNGAFIIKLKSTQFQTSGSFLFSHYAFSHNPAWKDIVHGNERCERLGCHCGLTEILL